MDALASIIATDEKQEHKTLLVFAFILKISLSETDQFQLIIPNRP